MEQLQTLFDIFQPYTRSRWGLTESHSVVLHFTDQPLRCIYRGTNGDGTALYLLGQSMFEGIFHQGLEGERGQLTASGRLIDIDSGL